MIKSVEAWIRDDFVSHLDAESVGKYKVLNEEDLGIERQIKIIEAQGKTTGSVFVMHCIPPVKVQIDEEIDEISLKLVSVKVQKHPVIDKWFVAL